MLSSTYKLYIDFLSVARRFEGIFSLLYNMILPSLNHDQANMVDQNHELKSSQSENYRLFNLNCAIRICSIGLIFKCGKTNLFQLLQRKDINTLWH